MFQTFQGIFQQVLNWIYFSNHSSQFIMYSTSVYPDLTFHRNHAGIRVIRDPRYTLACRKRRQKPKSPVTAGVARKKSLPATGIYSVYRLGYNLL